MTVKYRLATFDDLSEIVRMLAEDFLGKQRECYEDPLPESYVKAFREIQADPNNEFETVPAYIRRNMDMYNDNTSSVENFYSNYTVKPDGTNSAQISTINSFLHGKKPD